jgi:hypothetical protein
MLQPVKAMRSALARRRAARDRSARLAAAERLSGLFADVAPGRSLVDELIADRRVEAAAEDRDEAEYLARRLSARQHAGR